MQQLISIKDEFEAAQAAVDYLERSWPPLHREPEFASIRFSQVQLAASNLEAAYIVRLFSVFESILRQALPVGLLSAPDRRGAYDLINRAASKWRISTAVRDRAHRVREYRNRSVHQNTTGAVRLVFADALARLNYFLAWVP